MEIIKGKCPLCRSDLYGSEKYGYFCRKCKIFFRKKHLYSLFKKGIDKGKK